MFDLIVTAIAVVGLATLYAAGLLAGYRWFGRHLPLGAEGPRWVGAFMAGLFAPVWVPVWAVGRWIRGPKPQPRPSTVGQVVLARDPANVEHSVVIYDDLTPRRPMTDEERAVMTKWWDEIFVKDPPTGIPFTETNVDGTASPLTMEALEAMRDRPILPRPEPYWWQHDTPQIIEQRPLTPHDQRTRTAKFTELPPV